MRARKPTLRTSASAFSPDRLIWLPLLALMAVALVADQARANLHQQARAIPPATARFDDPVTAEAWCRMHLGALIGDEALGFDAGPGFDPTSAFGRASPFSMRLPGRLAGSLPARSVDASR